MRNYKRMFILVIMLKVMYTIFHHVFLNLTKGHQNTGYKCGEIQAEELTRYKVKEALTASVWPGLLLQGVDNRVSVSHDRASGHNESSLIKESSETLLQQFQENVLQYRNATRLVYNRLPKCGSTAVHVTMGRLSKILNYTLYISSIFTHHRVDRMEQERIMRQTRLLKEPWIFDRHVFFINFTAYNEQMPIYINTIRDPVDRIVSWYYFIRFQPMHIRQMSNERKMRSYDDCVQNGLEECIATSNYTQFYNFMYIPFFCGSEDFCLQQTPRALNQAKMNVIKSYALVGLMDDLPNFFYALEYLLPQFFAGSLESYQENANNLAKRFSTKNKIPASDRTREMMQSLLRLEYELYYFVKQRFYNILENIKKLKES